MIRQNRSLAKKFSSGPSISFHVAWKLSSLEQTLTYSIFSHLAEPSGKRPILSGFLCLGWVLRIDHEDCAANLATENINRSIKSVARTITRTALSDKVSSKSILEKAGLRTLNEMVASQTAFMVRKSKKAKDPLGRKLFPVRSIMRHTRSINSTYATQPVPGNNTLAANLMSRAWNSSTELHTVTTIGAAKSVARKWAQNLPVWTLSDLFPDGKEKPKTLVIKSIYQITIYLFDKIYIYIFFTFRYCKNKSLRLSDTVSLIYKTAKYITDQQQRISNAPCYDSFSRTIFLQIDFIGFLLCKLFAHSRYVESLGARGPHFTTRPHPTIFRLCNIPATVS